MQQQQRMRSCEIDGTDTNFDYHHRQTDDDGNTVLLRRQTYTMMELGRMKNLFIYFVFQHTRRMTVVGTTQNMTRDGLLMDYLSK